MVRDWVMNLVLTQATGRRTNFKISQSEGSMQTTPNIKPSHRQSATATMGVCKLEDPIVTTVQGLEGSPFWRYTISPRSAHIHSRVL